MAYVTIPVRDYYTDRVLVVQTHDGKWELPSGELRHGQNSYWAGCHMFQEKTGFNAQSCGIRFTPGAQVTPGMFYFHGQCDFSGLRLYDIFSARPNRRKYKDYGFATLCRNGKWICIETYTGKPHLSQTVAEYAVPTLLHTLKKR